MEKHQKGVLSICVAFSLLSVLFVPPSPAQTSRESTLSESLSFQDVTAFAQDSLGYMWIATLGGLNRYNGYEFEQFLHDSSNPESLPDDFVFSLFIDSSHRLWAGTASGVCRYDFDSGTFVRYPGVPASAATYGFFEDHAGQLWTATPDGPGKIDLLRNTVTFSGPARNVHLFWEDDSGQLWMGLGDRQGLAVRKNGHAWDYCTLPGERQVTCMYSDPQGLWWLGTNDGILLFDPDTFSFRFPTSLFPARERVNTSHITFIKEIEPLKVMIGTETEGFFLYDMMAKSLTHNTPAHFNPRNSAQLHTCYVDRRKNVWIGTYDKGIVVGNKQSDHFNPDNVLSDLIEEKFVTRVVEDHGRNLWIATRYNGLFRYSKSGNTHFYKPSDLLPSGNEFLEVVYIDSQDRLWIAFQSRLIIARTAPDGTLHIDRRFDIDNVRVIKEAPDHNFWIGTWEGLFKIGPGYDMAMVEHTATSNITDILFLDSGDMLYSAYGNGIFILGQNEPAPRLMYFPEADLPVSRTIITLFEDSQHRLWLGSYGNGLLCRSAGRLVRLSTEDGLPSNNILCFQEDFNGNIWGSTSRGISRLKPAGDGFSVTNFYNRNILPGNQYHEKSGCRTADGSIYFGGNHGLTFFNPSGFLPSSTPPPIHIEDLKIFNKSVRPAPTGSVLSRSILFTDEITLNHRQRMISLDYAGIDFYTSNNLTYKYKLEGFDKGWNYVGTYRRASYSSLPPGEYTFMASAINEEGVESAVPATLKIVVKPAPWFTWQAWTAYSVLLAMLIFFLLRAFLNAKLNKQRAEMEHNEKEREKEIARMKITFFTNISHELRTPLTLIAAPLEKLLKEGGVNETGKKLVAVADRNAHRMQQLIDQLMDSVKIENGVLSLHVKEIDIMTLLFRVCESFNPVAEQKGIGLKFHPHVSGLTIWADADKVEKILYNLLSNAIKHTPEKGEVVVRTEEETGRLVISVSDTGEGVPADRMNDLFVRYRRIGSPSGAKPDYSGNGIGLHYTKTLVEKHRGEITARNRPEGGMTFSFILPLQDVYAAKEKEAGEALPSPAPAEAGPVSVSDGAEPGSKRKDRILVVEDNVELKHFLIDLFSGHYDVTGAASGNEAWSVLESVSPDLILSDVIMPGLSGYDLCRNIKQSREHCHIPVVLLTAKTSLPEQIEGLEFGADAYICKPFNVDYLLLTVKNLLHRRDLLLEYLSTPKPEAKPLEQGTVNERDRKFLDKLTELLEEELSNPDLNIDRMAQNLGFSRTALYRKIKGLTGLAPNDFIRNYRFKCAAELLMDGNMPLTEVAEQTGFNSYSYFSKAFKQHFGSTPSEYQSRLLNPGKQVNSPS